MSLLIGIKKTHTSGSFHGADGFEGISMGGTITDIIKEGSHNELMHFVLTKRAESVEATKKLEQIEDELEFSGMTETEYEYEVDKLRDKLILVKYDKLIIIEGRTV